MAKKKTTKKSTSRKAAAASTSRAKAARTSSTKKTTRKVTKTAKTSTKKTTKKAVAASGSTRKTTGKTTKKAAATSPKKSTTVAVDSLVPVHKGKSPLTAKEIKYYRNLLLVKRMELFGDVESMSEEALRQNDSSNLSHMPIHMADIGSDNFEQELMLELVASERQLLREIDEALERVMNGTYGVCEATGKPINKARLDAKPWAKYCIEAAREMERNGSVPRRRRA